MAKHYDAVIIGAGVAGLTAALHAPTRRSVGRMSIPDTSLRDGNSMLGRPQFR